MKNILMLVLVSATIGFGLVALKDESKPVWNCAAEDEVVVIDNTCRHIDTLQNAIQCDAVIRYKDGEITCELFIRESKMQEVLQRRYITQEDRI